ncbi:hypothetical protein GCM10027021_40960 [Dyella kyungheensis]
MHEDDVVHGLGSQCRGGGNDAEQQGGGQQVAMENALVHGEVLATGMGRWRRGVIEYGGCGAPGETMFPGWIKPSAGESVDL